MIDLCEFHADNVPATMLVTFDPADRPFRVCIDCAFDAIGYGRTVDARPIDLMVTS